MGGGIRLQMSVGARTKREMRALSMKLGVDGSAIIRAALWDKYPSLRAGIEAYEGVKPAADDFGGRARTVAS